MSHTTNITWTVENILEAYKANLLHFIEARKLLGVWLGQKEENPPENTEDNG